MAHENKKCTQVIEKIESGYRSRDELLNVKPIRNRMTVSTTAMVMSTIERYLKDSKKDMSKTRMVEIGCCGSFFMEAAATVWGATTIGVETDHVATVEMMRRMKNYTHAKSYVASVPAIEDITSFEGADVVYYWTLGYNIDITSHIIELAIRSKSVKVLVLCHKENIEEGPRFYTDMVRLHAKSGRSHSHLYVIKLDKSLNSDNLPPYEPFHATPTINPVTEALDFLTPLSIDDYANIVLSQFTQSVLSPVVAGRGRNASTLYVPYSHLCVPVLRARNFYLYKSLGKDSYTPYVSSNVYEEEEQQIEPEEEPQPEPEPEPELEVEKVKDDTLVSEPEEDNENEEPWVWNGELPSTPTSIHSEEFHQEAFLAMLNNNNINNSPKPIESPEEEFEDPIIPETTTSQHEVPTVDFESLKQIYCLPETEIHHEEIGFLDVIEETEIEHPQSPQTPSELFQQLTISEPPPFIENNHNDVYLSEHSLAPTKRRRGRPSSKKAEPEFFQPTIQTIKRPRGRPAKITIKPSTEKPIVVNENEGLFFDTIYSSCGLTLEALSEVASPILGAFYHDNPFLI